VTEVFGALDETALLNAALARRLRRGVTLDDPASRRRIIQALLRQGFSMDAIRRAMREQTDE
jgi:SOS response regulatory protein OraA/RecX